MSQLADDASLYYYLPADIIGLLLDYLPLNMHNRCHLVPCITINKRIHCMVSPQEVLIDSIVKHDLEYFTRSWSALDDIRYEPPIGFGHRQNTTFMIALHDCWRNAFKYGRLKFLDVLLEMERKGYYQSKKVIQETRMKPGNNLLMVMMDYHVMAYQSIDYCDPNCSEPTYAVWDEYRRYHYESAPDMQTIDWIDSNCHFMPSYDRDYKLIKRAIYKDNPLILELLYRRISGPRYNIVSFTLISSSRRKNIDHIFAAIKTSTKVKEWFESHTWLDEHAAKLLGGLRSINYLN
jgi:hypothetical protein